MKRKTESTKQAIQSLKDVISSLEKNHNGNIISEINLKFTSYKDDSTDIVVNFFWE